MAQAEEKLRYRPELDILYYNQGEKSKNSLDIGNITLDFGRKGQIVGLEIHKASKTLSDLTGGNIQREQLKKIEDIAIKVNYQQDAAMIVILLYYPVQSGVEQESINLSMAKDAVGPKATA
ncbi:MAG: DUF2283 domain-containing protein [Candidatus Nanohaloarchaea archaeon]|nr:DUF2283 domain-containing protein [Candidatus Nanohaloarchaea archaeon]